MAACISTEAAIGLTINILALAFAILQSMLSWQSLVALKTEQRAGMVSTNGVEGNGATEMTSGRSIELPKSRPFGSESFHDILDESEEC